MSAAAPPSPSSRAASGRLLPIDALRGLIMTVMALDQANYFISRQHTTGEFWGGPIPHYDTALAFITRFLTHFAAPGFFFLMGASMVLMASGRAANGWSPGRVRTYFLKRGALLLVLQQGGENPGSDAAMGHSSNVRPLNPLWRFLQTRQRPRVAAGRVARRNLRRRGEPFSPKTR